jgi:hypothetical protein
MNLVKGWIISLIFKNLFDKENFSRVNSDETDD